MASFSVRVGVRSYELDMNGHVNHAVYHQFGEHARSSHLAAAGCTFGRMVEVGLGIVLLETRVRFLRELRQGDEVEIDSRLEFGEGRAFTIDQTIRRDDGVVAAEISCVVGLLDQGTRRLVPAPADRLREIATAPEVLGL